MVPKTILNKPELITISSHVLSSPDENKKIKKNIIYGKKDRMRCRLNIYQHSLTMILKAYY